jgi:hypothetical protein
MRVKVIKLCHSGGFQRKKTGAKKKRKNDSGPIQVHGDSSITDVQASAGFSRRVRRVSKGVRAQVRWTSRTPKFFRSSEDFSGIGGSGRVQLIIGRQPRCLSARQWNQQRPRASSKSAAVLHDGLAWFVTLWTRDRIEWHLRRGMLRGAIRQKIQVSHAVASLARHSASSQGHRRRGGQRKPRPPWLGTRFRIWRLEKAASPHAYPMVSTRE